MWSCVPLVAVVAFWVVRRVAFFERMRDAHGRSNVLRPLQSRFKARKKPEGYTSTPTGLKRLKTGLQRFRTQNTAFRGNGNGKGTPSGVPQPIHKRKLILVKEEFDASSSGGAKGIRTPDPLHAMEMRYQLRHSPEVCSANLV